MVGSRFDFVPARLAQLSIVWKHLCRRKYLGGDVDNGPVPFVAASNSILFYGAPSRNCAGARFYVVDRCFYTFDCAT